MSAVITRNSYEGDSPVTPPLKADGSMYRYAMLFDGFKNMAFADTHGDLIEVLLGPDYRALDPEAQLRARHEYAVNVQVWLQAKINSSEEFDLNSVDVEEYATLMGSRDSQPEIAHWASELPLVLVTTGYAPHTDVPVPTEEGNGVIVWLTPENEEGLLTSLNYVGEVRLAEAEATGDITSE